MGPSPDLVLQEAHVAVQQGVGGGQDAHRLHPGAALHRALHRHVGETRQAEVAPLPEVTMGEGGGGELMEDRGRRERERLKGTS